MNGWRALDRFLQTDPQDVGCAEAMEILRYPGVAAHLRACGPCGEDFEGLLAALHDEPR
jgi:hypothetical protein